MEKDTENHKSAVTADKAQAANAASSVSLPATRRVAWWCRVTKKRRLMLALIIWAVLTLMIGLLIARQRSEDHKKEAQKNPIISSYQKQLPALADEVKKNTDDPKARQNYAVALYATGDLGKAKEQYESGVKLAPQDATLRNNLGNTYRDLGDYKKAVAAYQKSIELSPKQTTAYINLANLYLYTLNKKDLAIKTYQDGMANSPDNQDMQVLLGIAYEQAGDKDSARQTFQNVLDKNSQNTAAQAGLKRVQ